MRRLFRQRTETKFVPCLVGSAAPPALTPQVGLPLTSETSERMAEPDADMPRWCGDYLSYAA